MSAAYNQASGILVRSSEGDPSCGSDGIDVLSDVLTAVRLTGALFFLVDAAHPWAIPVPDAGTLAPVILPQAQHVISYHVVLSGSCWGGIEGGRSVCLGPGDVLVFPHGHAYLMQIQPEAKDVPAIEDVLGVFREIAAGRLPFRIREGGDDGERLQLMCGFLGCDVRPFNPLLSTLPPVLHIPRHSMAAGDRLAHLVDFVLADSSSRLAGAAAVRVRLSELMFIEVVRRYLAALPTDQTGWLAGLRDPDIGRALALLHAAPAHRWTLEGLARAIGVSRSVLAERFTGLVGHAPMHYLALWRMQVAARLLAAGDSTVASVAVAVGYDSDAAFSRAFKRAAGVSPASWRRMSEPSRHPISA